MKSLINNLLACSKSEKGYLLLETLIAATILLALLPLTLLKAVSVYESQQTNQFIQSLTEFIYEAQETAFSEKRNVYVELDDTHSQIYSYFSTFDRLYTLDAPPSIHFQKGSIATTIRFTPQGTIAQAGTFYLVSKSAIYQVTFLLGQGRFYVKKQ